MDETPLGRYVAPALDPTHVAVCERVEVESGVGFAVVTDAEALDGISEDLSRGAFPESYRPLLELLQALVPAGGRVLDLGTHVGTFSLAAAAKGYQVLGVEASPRNASLLRESVERNGFDGRLRLVHAAVSDRPGTLEFCQGGPYGHVRVPGIDAPAVSVPAVRVDDLLDEAGWDRVDFIKMDVEGSEVAGLRGMSRLLSRPDAPPIFVESNGHTLAFFGQTPDSLKAELEGFGYTNHLVDSSRLLPVRPGELQPTTCVDYLATKGTPPKPRTWRVDPPMSRSEIVRKVVDTSRSPNPFERRYIARALATTDASLRGERPVLAAIEALRSDPSEQVRSAALAVGSAGPRRPWFLRWRG